MIASASARARSGGTPARSDRITSSSRPAHVRQRSTSQALDILLLEAAGLKPDDAELVKTGGFGEAVVALNLGLIDASAIADPVWSKNKSQFRVLVSASDVLPPREVWGGAGAA